MGRSIIFSIVLLSFSNFSSAQLCLTGKCQREKASKGRYENQVINEMNANDRPLAVFDATQFDSIVPYIQRIQGLLLNDSSLEGSLAYDLQLNYTEILNLADDSTFDNFDYWGVESNEDGGKKSTSVFKGSIVAKSAAFAFAIGVIRDTSMSEDLVKVNPSNSAHVDILNGYWNRAINILHHLESRSFGESKFKPAPWNMNEYGQFRYQEIIQYVSAYELLRVSKTFRFINNNQQTEIDQAKLALQGTIKRVFRNSGYLVKNHNNNHTLMFAGAMGLSAVVLHDVGHRKGKKNWHSAEWAKEAHWYLNETLFDTPSSGVKSRMSNRDTLSGYAEGPHYFMYGFQSVAPFLIAMKNFLPEHHSQTIEHKNETKTINNYDYQKEFHNLYRWYNMIQMPTGIHPHYDNSRVNSLYPYFLKVLNNGDHFLYDVNGFGIVAENAYRPEVAASLNIIRIPSFKNHIASNKSGDLVLSSPFSDSSHNRVYMHVLNENGVAVNGGGHEHADPNNFIISAGEFPLIIDPGMIGYTHRDWFNHGSHHNIMSSEILGDEKWPTKTGTKDDGNIKENTLVMSTSHASCESETRYQFVDYLKRVKYINSASQEYFIMADYADDILSSAYHLNIGGNGNEFDSTFDEMSTGKYQWYHPKTVNEDVINAIQSYTVLSGGGLTTDIRTDTTINAAKTATVHANNEGTIGEIYSFPESGVDIGFHTKVKLTQDQGSEAKFLTIFWPFQYGDSVPEMEEYNNAGQDFGMISIKDIGEENIYNFHGIADNGSLFMVQDPVLRDPNETIHFRAEQFTLSVSNQQFKNFRECTAETPFRFASIDNGDSLKYRDTTYLASSKKISFGYELTGKFNYMGYAINEGADSATISILLPDLDTFSDMIVVSTLNMDTVSGFSYNKSTRTATFEVLDSSTVEFIIEPRDPCLVSCYFPHTDTTIYNTFDFDDGSKQVLGHHLDIVQDTGHLKMTNGSKLVICTQQLLANRDSITMRGLPTDEPLEGYSLPPSTGSSESGSSSSDQSIPALSQRMFSDRTMIIVEDEAALVLESNSHTHIGSYSTIYIKSGGTLLIEDSSTVEIGGEGLGNGEIIAEDGAYVCVADSTDVHFYLSELDLRDKNIFYVSMRESPNGTLADLHEDAIHDKFDTDSIYDRSNYFCIDFCEIKDYLLPNGINNREFGWSNISYPRANIEMADTFCEGSEIPVQLEKSLNETSNYVRIAEVDTNTLLEKPETIELIPDTLLLGWDTLRASTIFIDDLFSAGFDAGKRYRISLEIKNDCEESSDTSHDFWITKASIVSLTTPDEACPGFETISCDGSLSSGADSFFWSITRIDTFPIHQEDTSYFGHSYSFPDTSETSAYADMSFPDYQVYGGYSYEIVLAGANFCGISEAVDTVDVPLSASVSSDIQTIINGGTPDSAQLTGLVTGQDTFYWSPTTGMLSPLSLTTKVSPGTTTSYILTAEDDSICSESDTVTITVNTYAFAGQDSVLCIGDSVTIGSVMSALPGTYSVLWSPSTGLSDSTAKEPKASPSVTTIYTLSVLDEMSTVVETDQVTVFVNDTLEAGFVLEQNSDSSTFLFNNATEPYDPQTTHKWFFGDGDSSEELNPVHTYTVVAQDTMFFLHISLTSTNECGISTAEDSLAVDTFGMISHPEKIPLPENEISFNKEMPNTKVDLIDPDISDAPASSALKEVDFLVRPNPFTTKLVVSINNSLSGSTHVELLSTTGKKILETKLKGNSEFPFMTGHLTSGVYYVRAIHDDKVIGIMKVVKL